MAQTEKLPAEIADAARMTALRSLHRLTCLIEDQLWLPEPHLPLFTAFREVTAALEALGPIGIETVLIEES